MTKIGRKMLNGGLAMLALGWAAVPAAAQWGGGYRYDWRDRGGYVDRYGRPSRTARCIKMCAHDNNPCDPIYFKTMDGRCTSDRW